MNGGALLPSRSWLTLVLITALVFTCDRTVISLVNRLAVPVATFIAEVLAPLGSPVMQGLLGLGLAFYFKFVRPSPIRENAAVLFYLSAMGSGVAAQGAKILFGRARPWLYLDGHIYGLHPFVIDTDYWSLPSDHAAVAGALAVTLSAMAPECRRWLTALACLVAFSRVVLLRNYLSDALLGLLLGMACATLLVTAFDRLGLQVRDG
jgi:membrane-associated phospholipid phosphatase